MTEQMNRAQRRAVARSTGQRRQRLKHGLVAVSAVAALGTGTVMAPAGQAFAATPAPSSAALGGADLGAMLGMLDDPLVSQFIEMCRTGGLATGPDASKSTEFDPANPPAAIADCSKSNGTGIALVLPDSLEVGQAAENMTLDLGDDINLLLVKYRMGERNLFEVLGGVVLGSDTIKSLANGVVGVRVDPGAFDKYKTYEAIQRDAALPINPASKDGCLQSDGSIKNFDFLKGCTFVGGTKVSKGQDLNLGKRTEALKMAEYLTGHKYDYSTPQELPSPAKPIGSSTIVGDGINVALSMRGGTALAQTRNSLALALAGADNGRTSTASSLFGFASALNMDTSDIKFTWFGQEIDFSKLRAAGLLDSPLAGEAGAEAGEMLDMLEGLNGNVPGLKEVACFGVHAQATAEGLGSCTNILGTFDHYKDLRPATDGSHRQEQWGLTDATSLLFGNDALLKQLGPALGGDTDSLMDSPFIAGMLKALTSEDDRIKFAKDFVRFTKDVQTKIVPVLDADGNPVLDADGNPVTKTETITAHWLTSDYGLRNPLTIQWMGHQIVFFPPVEINGSTRPNLIGLPQITKIADDARVGLLPKISLVQWDNPFGLGTLSLDNPFDPVGTLRNYIKSVTIVDDLKSAKDLFGQLTAEKGAADAPADAADADALPEMVVNAPSTDLAPTVVKPAPTPSPIEIAGPDAGNGDGASPTETPSDQAPAPDATAPDATAPDAPAADSSVSDDSASEPATGEAAPEAGTDDAAPADLVSVG
ncbi:MAG: hypothetical protein WBA05_07285 [Gordonia sp. (in: high G+C Gram-positive bacteria)]|uniref:hypothetical protein n=1 Tax=Gordonia sp. (in: high G+C Gram-positive bacteria) TaxID=84139 RepID=UPI003C741D42